PGPAHRSFPPRGDFCKTRRLPLSDQLILGLSASNLLHALQKGYVLYKLLFHLARNEYDEITTQVFTYLNMCTLWFSTLLSIHFCLKIVNIHHWFYIGLQKRIPTLFPWITITFLLGFFFLTLYSALEITQDCLLNTTSKVKSMKPGRCSWLFYLFIALSSLFSFLCSVSALTIIISLCKHMKRIQENTEGSRSPNMDAHIRAIKTVTTLLATNILICTSVFLAIIIQSILTIPIGILISICHIFSSYFLIKGTKKLDKTFLKILNRCSLGSFRNQ
ncbi:taste receptor type 2 member 50-like, partial [Hyla sarda]|uniref:taste receptor type 2 member 50-like n=1 Tax=Hyla sarda TaxID=327740 RepID=UPI0024C3C9D8